MTGGRERRWISLGIALLFSSALVGACAVGGGEGTGEDGSGASGPTSSSQSGSGGSTSMSSSDASSSSSGTPCEEMPCKVVAPQCGCPDGEKCTTDGDGGRECVAEGMAATGESCNFANTCVAGNLCLNTLGASMCRKFCDDDNQCSAPGGLCALQINDGNGGVWPETFCSENCDPVSGTGCGIATAKCEVGLQQGPPDRFFTLCTGFGSGTQGAACGDTGDCASGYGCFNNGTFQCLRWCTPNNNPNCPVGTCLPFAAPGITIGSLEYGVCL